MLIILTLLLQIKWDNCYKCDNGSECLISVDGTDCPIAYAGHDARAYFSHKFRDTGFRYEVGLCIQTGELVWVSGPFPCGRNPDITIFRARLRDILDPGKKVEADKGYHHNHPDYVRWFGLPGESINHNNTAQKAVRARHEHINARLKAFKILDSTYRDKLDNHGAVFNAVAVICQLNIYGGQRLGDIYYYSP